jgi:hypothetical protein
MEKILKQFDKQINFEFKTQLGYAISEQRLNTKEIIEWKKNKKNLMLCESYLAKQIFLKSIDFTIDDWKEIRKGDYYNEISLESGLNKKLYKLAKIEEYLNN